MEIIMKNTSIKTLEADLEPKNIRVIDSWKDFSKLNGLLNSYITKGMIECLSYWQTLINYLVAGNDLYVCYMYNAINGSIGKLSFEGKNNNILDYLRPGLYNYVLDPVFKIKFEGTRSVDYLTIGRYNSVETNLSQYFTVTTSLPHDKKCYLTTSSFYKKKIAKSNIVYDRYGTQITEGCHVFASIPGKPPSIETGKIVKITDSGIIWFQQIGKEHIMKGTLRNKSCVVITDTLVNDILLEKLSLM